MAIVNRRTQRARHPIEGVIALQPAWNSGLKVSVVGLGTNNFGRRLDESSSARVIDAALDGGITFLDTADVYGTGTSEDIIGKAIKGRRDGVILATKFSGGMGDGPVSPAEARGATCV